MRRLHDEGFRLKVPRPWPDGQDEEKRKAFIELIRKFLGDQGIDLWFLDECGVEGDPRPRKRFAMKGDKILQAYAGAHLRMNDTGMVSPRKGEWFSGFYAKTKNQLIDRLTEALRWLINRQDQNIKTCAIPTEL